MVSDKIRSAVRVLRICARGQSIDTDTLTALIHHLDQAALDVSRIERHAVVRARPPLPITVREEALIGLVHCAAAQLPAPRSVGVLRHLARILRQRPEVVS